jgi:protein phosphatase
MKKYITVRFHSRTDPGRVRPGNEDAFLADGEAGLFAVADGMGGHAAGEVASRLAIEALPGLHEAGPARPDTPADGRKWLASLVARANRAVYEAARSNPDQRGMGTTLTVLYIRPPVACFAHVGDSRLYRFRDGRLQQLTRDHTWVQEQVDAGLLSPSQAQVHPHRSMLTRAIGIAEDVAVDSGDVDVEPGDVFLLASDGLSSMLSDEEIAGVLARDGALDAMADALIEAANARGGYDNITVVLVRAE